VLLDGGRGSADATQGHKVEGKLVVLGGRTPPSARRVPSEPVQLLDAL
jgi:hypothetical protein